MVLGAIIEAVSGENYFDYIQKHVFDPAGMSGSGFFDVQKIVPDLAIGHTRREAERVARKHARAPRPARIPAGGSYSSARDLLAFDRALRAEASCSTSSGRAGSSAATHRARASSAGGSPGVNAAVASDGTWTVVVLTNIDPPTGEKFAKRSPRR